MKKFASLLLALTMALAMAVPAFADNLASGEINGDTSKNVEATYTQTPDGVQHTYHVTIEWGVPAFTYNFKGTQYTWQTDKLNYTATGTTGEEGWADNGSKNITLRVINSSDMAVNCSATLTKNASQPDGLNVTYTQRDINQTSAAAAITVAEGDWGKYTAENSGKTTECDLGGTITVTGAPDKSVATLATITVTVSK